MIPKISYRYGYNTIEKCGLSIWTFGWCVGLFFILRTGIVAWHTPDGGVIYSRAGEPITYWTIVAVTMAVCLLGLALTFEFTFKEQNSEAKSVRK